MSNNSYLYNPHLEGGSFYWPGGPVGVLLSHGFTATTAEVRLLGRILHQHGYTVSGPLLAGHGTQPKFLNRTRWQEWYHSVQQAYLQLTVRCEKVIVGGESTGALLALYLASVYPEITAVLTYAPALRLTLSRIDRLRLTLAAPFLLSVPKASLDAESNWQGYPVNPLKGTLQLLHLQRQVLKRLPSIRQPILIMQGRLDTTVSSEAPQMIYAQVASRVKELHWMEHSAHCVIIDQELARVADLTLQFITRALAL
jgi:carboxylesterase